MSPRATPPDSPIDVAQAPSTNTNTPTDKAILVVTHEECIHALLLYLMDAQTAMHGPLSGLEVPSHLKESMEGWLLNTAVVTIDIRWEGSSKPRGRLEMYGDVLHLTENYLTGIHPPSVVK